MKFDEIYILFTLYKINCSWIYGWLKMVFFVFLILLLINNDIDPSNFAR